jgi:hypothetical protein
MPQIAALYGVTVDPKAPAPRPLRQPRTEKPVRKKASQVNAAAAGKKQAKPETKPAPVPAAAVESAPAEPAEATPEVTAD